MSATCSSCGPARRSRPTASSWRAQSAVDQSMLTGESCRSRSAPGAEVAGATVNTYGRLVVRATKVGADTALAQIARLVEEAQSGKAPVQRLADRVSAVFVPVVHRDLARDARRAGSSTRSIGRDGVHGRGRRAHHRLPVRARPRDADGAHGRHRPRRAARHPHQGPGGPRADAADRRRSCSTRRARSPRAAWSSSRSLPLNGATAAGDPAARRRGRGRLRASDRAGGRGRGAGRGRRAPDGRGLPQRARRRRPRERSRATPSRSGAATGAITVVVGRRAARDARRPRHGQADERRGDRRARSGSA